MLKAAIAAVCIISSIASANADPWWQESYEPTPSAGGSGQPQQSETKKSQQSPAADQRETDNYPLIVKVLPSPKTKEEADQAAKDRLEKSANDREVVTYSRILDVLTAILAFIGCLQLVVFGYQARQLRRTVSVMERADRPQMVVSDLKVSGIT